MSFAESPYGAAGTIHYQAGRQITSALLLTLAAAASRTLSSNDPREIRFDSSAGDATVYLPAAPDDGMEYYLQMQAGGNTISVHGNGNNINGIATFSFIGFRRAVTLKWTGMKGADGNAPEWLILSDTAGTGGVNAAAVLAALAAAAAAIAVNSQKITGLAAGTAAGDALRWEQGGLQVAGGSGASADTIGAATKYLPRSGNVAAAQVPLGIATRAGILRSLRAGLNVAPGGADTVVFTVQKSSDQGATWTDTTLTCTISAAAKSNSDLTNRPAVAAGDWLAVKMVSSAGTAAGPVAGFEYL
jgi:hypothetical protein